jgi:hypothetical protein
VREDWRIGGNSTFGSMNPQPAPMNPSMEPVVISRSAQPEGVGRPWAEADPPMIYDGLGLEVEPTPPARRQETYGSPGDICSGDDRVEVPSMATIAFRLPTALNAPDRSPSTGSPMSCIGRMNSPLQRCVDHYGAPGCSRRPGPSRPAPPSASAAVRRGGFIRPIKVATPRSFRRAGKRSAPSRLVVLVLLDLAIVIAVSTFARTARRVSPAGDGRVGIT